jgi:hypothetical protein
MYVLKRFALPWSEEEGRTKIIKTKDYNETFI